MALQEAGVRLVAEGAGAFNNQMERASQGVDNFGKNAGSAAGGIDLMNVATVALGSALGDLAVRGLEAATNAITGFIRTGFDYNKSIENATAQLVAFTGSQEAAAEALELVERKAAQTPFAFDEMAQSAASLAATSRATGASLEELLDLATRLAASNPAEGLEGAAFALREAFSGDFISLQERFNISKDTVKGIKEAGVSVETLSAAFNDLGITTELVSGLAQTFDGRMSTLLDTITKVAGAFTAPIFDAFSDFIGDVQVGLDKNIAKLEADARWVGQVAADVFTTAREAWNGEWVDDENIILPIHRFAGNATLVLRKVWDNMVIFGQESLPKIQEVWDRIIFKVGDVQKAWEPFNKVLEAGVGFFDSLGRLGGALRDVLFGVEGNTGKANKQFGTANTLGETLAGFFERIASAIERINAIIDSVATGIQNAVDAAASMGNFNGLMNPDETTSSGMGNTPDSSPPPAGGWGNTPDTNPTSPMPAPVSQSPRTSSGGGGSNRTTNNVNVQVNVPAGVSPAVASRIVSDGIVQAQRSRGMA